ncbi:ubiquitin carboxyl-terminal hydrolase 2-like [Lolium rigidum]|uniref:ubiquitin carboxyl-terminal hydrolase 2-like n=1 Tax=Lolium rigidum TaxID=89674 RepID=UPI001F5CCC3C|nr:ubiquitin carboxyl-terminal hydrolase 2-like [Lolium rigidum]
MADEATENPQKSRRLDTDAAEALLDLSHSPPSKREAEAATGDSTYDIGSCEHLFKDSEDLDEIARDLRDAHKPPKCEHFPCSTTWRGAAGMMVCTECSLTFCTGEKGSRGHPQGHAAWHAASDKHWVALWCDEPSKGYCFECRRILMLGQSKAIEDNYALVPRNKKDEWGMVASNWGMLGSNVMRPTGMLGSTVMDPWGMLGSNALDRCGMVAGDDHVVRGIPNLGDTCYMNAALQCLLALGKLRTMFLRPDARLGDIGLHLKQLFVATSCGNTATQMPDPEMMPTYMWSLYPDRFQRKVMGDSHEFLASLCDALHNEVEQLNNLQGEALFPTFSNSIFSCELLDMVSCKVCSHDEVTHYSLHGIQLAAPSKDPLARSNPLQVGSTEGKDTVHGLLQTHKNDIPRGIVEVKALDFIPKLFDDFGGVEELVADSHNPEEKEKAQSTETVHDVAEHMNSLSSIEDCLKLFSHCLTDCNNCSKVAAELPETDGSKNVEPIIASSNVNTTVDGDQTEMSDMKTCPSERSSDFGSLSAESPSRQPYLSDSHHQVTLSEDITSEEVTSGKSCDEKDLTCCSTTHEKAESHEGVQEAALSCLTTDEQTDLLSAQNIQDTSTQKHSSGKQVMYDHSAQEVAEKQNKQTAIQTRLISKLPPVLTIQLQRHSPGLPKLSGHVSFKEILHLGPFMDPSSEDKDNLSYRLVGVIEHIGVGVTVGHYIAYVRASRRQQGSGPSSWVCANDSMVRQASLEEVLRREAYILFYERIDDGGIVDDGQ